MTIQTFTPSELASVPADPSDGVAQIVRWAETANAAAALVDRLVDTPFFPAAFWPRPTSNRETAEEYAARREVAVASGTAAVLYGGEVGLTPLAALSSVVVVKGKPSLYAEVMVALVRSAGHQVRVDELTDRRCVMRGRRKGEAEWSAPVEFTIDRAQRAGYVAQNQKYKTDPQAMLYARCASILCKQLAPERLRGLPTVEDVQDEPDADAPRPATRTVQRSTPPRALEAAQALADRPPSIPGGLTVNDKVRAALSGREPDGAPLDEKQWRAINARFVDLGVRGEGQAAQRLQVIGHLLDRPVTRGGELTSAEADLVLASLAGGAGERVVFEVLGAGPVAQLERDRAAAAAETGQQAAAAGDVDAFRQAGPALPGEQDPPVDPWGINDPTGGAPDDDEGDDELDVPGDDQ